MITFSYAIFFIVIFPALQLSAGSQLDDFIRAFEKVDLNFDLGQNRQKRSPTIDELLARFEGNDDEKTDLEAGDIWYQSFRELECLHGGCKKHTLLFKVKQIQPEEDYDYEEQDDDIDLQDQFIDTKNDLSHEANYKLSKVEQDAVERNLPKTAWPVHHKNKKRSLNAMNAIKLKTSIKMQRHGYGLTLPSVILERRAPRISIEDMIYNSQQHHESVDPWKETYEVSQSRKILSIADPENAPEPGKKMCRSKDCLEGEQFDNLIQKPDAEEKFKSESFDNMDESQLTKKGTLESLSDQLLKSDAFMKFQNFLAGKRTDPSKANKTNTDKTSTTVRPTTKSPLNLVNKDREVNIKLHMSVNATVLGNGELPQQFHKNNTINFKDKPQIDQGNQSKKTLVDYEDGESERSRRGVVFPILTASSKRKANKEISKSVISATEDFPIDELVTTKLTSQLVKTIFTLVKTSPSLKILWPGLKNNRVSSPKEVQNFYAIRNQDNEQEMHRTELMIKEAMETINAIIEQQVRSRACVPLRADLRAFYELILATQIENEQQRDRQKREAPSIFAVNAEPLTDTQIRQKSRIVKKLLKDYEELPREDQDKVANIKDQLLSAAARLQELEQNSRRRKRTLLNNHLLTANYTVPEEFLNNTTFTPEYEKLAHTAEMILQHSIKNSDSDLTIDFDSI